MGEAEAEAQKIDAAVMNFSRRLTFEEFPQCPWFHRPELQGRDWTTISGETGYSPEAGQLKVRVEVEGRRGGWINVEPKDHWTVDQVSNERLLKLFGGGRRWRVSIRWKGDTLKGSTAYLDLTNDPDEPRPIPGDDTPAPPVAVAPAHPAVAASADPLMAFLSTLPAEARGPVMLFHHMGEREQQRMTQHYQAMLSAVQYTTTAAQTAQQSVAAGAPQLISRLESENATLRAERDAAVREATSLREDLWKARMRLALMEASPGGAPSREPHPLMEAGIKLLSAAMPGFGAKLAEGIPIGKLLEGLPPDQLAQIMGGAAGALGGGGGLH